MPVITYNLDQFIFHLNRSLVEDINNSNWKISDEFKQDVFRILLKNNHLIFSSYYCDELVIQTIYYPAGVLLQKVSQNYLEYPDLLNIVTQTHYLLINQLILSSLLTKPKNKSWLFLLILISLIIILIIIYFLLLRK